MPDSSDGIRPMCPADKFQVSDQEHYSSSTTSPITGPQSQATIANTGTSAAQSPGVIPPVFYNTRISPRVAGIQNVSPSFSHRETTMLSQNGGGGPEEGRPYPFTEQAIGTNDHSWNTYDLLDASMLTRRSPHSHGARYSHHRVIYDGYGRGSGKPPIGVDCCTSCHTTQSPEWRKGPSGRKDLCNA